MQFRTRIAPTPSGYLHMGNAFDFILAWLMARASGGRVMLRIDDLDAPRMRPEYLEEIFAALEWLELDFEEGPRNESELKTEYSQQIRLPLYQQMLNRLVHSGRVFACRCSRKDLEKKGPSGCLCAADKLSLNEKNIAWRFKTETDDCVQVNDVRKGLQAVNIHDLNPNFVVRRKDGLPAYHIASLTDDELWEMNFIVRGKDLWESTATQLLLAHALSLNHFPKAKFLHHPLIAGPEGEKLSKSAGADALKVMREKGVDAAVIFQEFCVWMELPFSANNATALLEKYMRLKES